MRKEPFLVLASSSPRRKFLLKQLGLPFITCKPSIVESLLVGSSLSTARQVENLAIQKGEIVQAQYPNSFILSADTVVQYKDNVLGKPATWDEAHRMLSLLNGKMHCVITGVSVLYKNRHFSASCTTKVWFRKLSKAFLEAYIKTGEPMDKAGAYGIQGLGALCVKRIDGDYFNVVGLPLNDVNRLLQRAGFHKHPEASKKIVQRELLIKS